MDLRFTNHGAKSAHLHGVQLPVIKKFAHCHAVVILGAKVGCRVKDLTLHNVHQIHVLIIFNLATCTYLHFFEDSTYDWIPWETVSPI